MCLRADFSTQPYARDDGSLLFHARWRIGRGIPSRPFLNGMHLDCAGRGRFVGGALGIRNGAARWWGEGDEKIYRDNEPFPGHFGTGSEDYQGYAWRSPTPFTHAYHNQARCDGPGAYGHNSLNRFHILDDIPFDRRFRSDMENWHHLDNVAVTRAAVSFRYARLGGTDALRPIGRGDVRLEDVPPDAMPDAVVSERLTVPDEDVRVQLRKAGMHYCGGRCLRWDAGEAGEPIDLSGPRECRTDEIALGPGELAVGANRIAVEMVGPGSRAGQGFAFGIDRVRIR